MSACSKYRCPINVAAHPAITPCRRACKKESPPLVPPANLRRFLQIQHLPQWHPPPGQDILMQQPALICRPALETRRVPGHGTEIAVVQPGDHVLRLLDAGPCVIGFFAEGDSGVFIRGTRVVVLGPAGADEKNVADLDMTALRGGADIYRRWRIRSVRLVVV